MNTNERYLLPAGEPARAETKLTTRRFFLLITPIYLAFGAILGFVHAGLPVILRSEGQSIESVGWVFLLYLPIGMSFLWASIVDRYPLFGLSGRRSWIVAMQIVAALLLLLIAGIGGR